MTDEPIEAGQGESAAILDGHPVPCELDGQTFYVRQPLPEEWDDGMSLQETVRKRMLGLPEIRALREQPISDEERETLQAQVAAAQTLYEAAEPGRVRDKAARQLDALRRALEKHTLADEVANERAVLARDRFLALRLLQDGDGRPLFDTRAKDLPEQLRQPGVLRLLEAARPAVWAALVMVQQAPFVWDPRRGPRSG